MGKVDRLSRRADWKVGVENDNNNQILIKEQWIYNLLEVVIEEPEVDIIEKIKIAESKYEKIVEKMKKAGVKVLWGDEWQIEGDLVLKKGKMYMLKNKTLRVKIIQLHYDIPITGYRVRWKMIELVMRNHWWLRVTINVGKYMEEYNICQRMKNRMEVPVGKFKNEQDTEETMNILESWLHYKVAIGSWEECNPSSLW